jgi:hypothetical protein
MRAFTRQVAEPEISARREMNKVLATMDDVTVLIETSKG